MSTFSRAKHDSTRAVMLVQLGALGCFAFTQPLFDLLGRYPEFLAVHGVNSQSELILLGAALVVVPVLLFSLIFVAATAIHRGLGVWAFRALLLGLSALVLLPPLHRQLGLSAVISLVAALSVGCLLVVLHARWKLLHSLFTALALAVPVFLIAFVAKNSAVAGRTLSVEKARNPSTVVLIVFDELPLVSLLDDQLEIDGASYPNFRRLADRSRWYRNASTVSGATLKVLPAIVTGRIPEGNDAPTTANFPNTLFTLLEKSHELVVSEARSSLYPKNLQSMAAESASGDLELLASDLGVLYANIVLPAQWRAKLPSVEDDWLGFGATRRKPDRAREFAEFVDSIEPAERPRLYFLHTMFPHNPYGYYPDGLLHSISPGEPYIASGRWDDDPDASLDGYRRHLLQVKYVDRMLGQLLDRLSDQGLFDDAMIVLTSDHGANFEAGGYHRRIDDEGSPCGILSVPLLIKLPGQREGLLSEANVELVDILPTIAESNGVEIPWPQDGISLLESEPSRPEKNFYASARKTLLNFPGDLEDCLVAAVRRKNELLASSVEVGYEPCPWRGREINEFQIQDDAQIEIELQHPERLKNVNRARGWVPGLLRGSFRWAPDSDVPSHIVVAVNDVVRTTVRLIDGDGATHKDFFALLRSGDLQDGGNRVDFYALEDWAEDRLRHLGGI